MISIADLFSPASVFPPSLQIVLPYLAVALTALITVFHHGRLKARLGEARGMRLYFSLFCLLLALIPISIIALREQEPGKILGELGLRPGDHRTGLLLLLIAFPVTVLLGYLASKTPAMKQQYPFSKAACSSDRNFILYEIQYVLLYYPAWEFLYRGLLFFPLLGSFGFVAAASVTTLLSTLHHFGHPDSEVAGAFVGGFILCFVAALTGSVIYPIAIHALVGVSDDLFIYAGYYRRKPIEGRGPGET